MRKQEEKRKTEIFRYPLFSPWPLSNCETPSGGRGGLDWRVGHRGPERLLPTQRPPWSSPLPAHSYVIICDKLLYSQATNPHVSGLAYKTNSKATCVRTCAHTHTHTLTVSLSLVHTLPPSHTHTHTHTQTHKEKQKLSAVATRAFVVWSWPTLDLILAFRETHSGVQQTDWAAFCRAQHFPLSALHFPKATVTKEAAAMPLCSRVPQKLPSTPPGKRRPEVHTLQDRALPF